MRSDRGVREEQSLRDLGGDVGGALEKCQGMRMETWRGRRKGQIQVGCGESRGRELPTLGRGKELGLSLSTLRLLLFLFYFLVAHF